MIQIFKGLLCALVLCCAVTEVQAQTRVSIKSGEKWYGGAVNDAHMMPFKEGYSLDMYGETRGNQAVPLLVSTLGRFIWSEEPFKFAVEKNSLIISMLGQKYLVAPVVTKDNEKTVQLPKGRWKDDKGEIFTGPREIKTLVAIDRLPVYELL